jgi:hypothetical protein
MRYLDDINIFVWRYEMDKRAKAEFNNFIKQAAQKLGSFPEVGQITLTKRGVSRRSDAPSKQRFVSRVRLRPPQNAQNDLTIEKIAETLYDSPEMKRLRAQGK